MIRDKRKGKEDTLHEECFKWKMEASIVNNKL